MTAAPPRSESLTADPSLVLPIDGMSCAACTRQVERALGRVTGVDKAEVDLVGRTARVWGSPTRDQLVLAVTNAGFEVPADLAPGGDAVARLSALEAMEAREAAALDRDLKVALALGLPVLVVGMAHGLLPMTLALALASAVLSTAVVLGPGRRYFKGAWTALRHGATDMATLVALGVGAAWSYSMVQLVAFIASGQGAHLEHGAHLPDLYFEAAVAILVFVLFGKKLETRARRHLSDATRALVGLVPDRATRLVPGEVDPVATEHEVPIASLRPGDLVRVRPGARIPVDGVVRSGTSAVDESSFNGESMPADKAALATVRAGTLVVDGTLDVEVVTRGEATALGRMIDAVERARGDKAPVARLADRVASVFVPIVLGLAVVTLIVHLALGAAASHALERFVTVLVIACPCALGLATPAAVAVGTGRLAELGVLVRGGATLEALARVDTICFDKTGTLTSGTPRVVETVTIAPDRDADALLALAAAVEAGSEHPLGRAIARACPAPASPAAIAVTGFQAHPGGGVTATVHEADHPEEIAIGSAAFMHTQGCDPSALEATATRLAADGATPVFIARRMATAPLTLIGLIGLRDEPLPEAAALIADLRATGAEIHILSGDRVAVVATLARHLGLPEASAQGGLSPTDKVARVAALQAQGRVVAMVGDGVNDAAALAQADVGIALAHGTDLAAKTADVVLAKGGLDGTRTALVVARKTLRIIRENLVWAFLYNVLGIPLAAGVFAGWTGWELSPAFASLAMALSSVSVVGNALRLRRVDGGARTPPPSRA